MTTYTPWWSATRSQRWWSTRLSTAKTQKLAIPATSTGKFDADSTSTTSTISWASTRARRQSAHVRLHICAVVKPDGRGGLPSFRGELPVRARSCRTPASHTQEHLQQGRPRWTSAGRACLWVQLTGYTNAELGLTGPGQPRQPAQPGPDFHPRHRSDVQTSRPDRYADRRYRRQPATVHVGPLRLCRPIRPSSRTPGLPLPFTRSRSPAARRSTPCSPARRRS